MEFLLIASAHFMALLSPGPDFFLIMQTSTRFQRKFGVSLCLGIALANCIYIALAVTGLEGVRDFNQLLILMKYIGGIYLVYVGITFLRAPRRTLESETAQRIENTTIQSFFLRGFLCAILNPKNMIFYLALFTVMVSSTTPFAVRILYGVWMCGLVLFWDLGIVFLLGSNRIKIRYENIIFTFEKIAGVVLAFFGCALPFS
jgi:threonine/homoserine/homoserine lactone efflux protein